MMEMTSGGLRSGVDADKERMKQVLEYLRKRQGRTIGGIATGTRINSSRLQRLVPMMVEEGLVEQTMIDGVRTYRVKV